MPLNYFSQNLSEHNTNKTNILKNKNNHLLSQKPDAPTKIHRCNKNTYTAQVRS